MHTDKNQDTTPAPADTMQPSGMLDLDSDEPLQADGPVCTDEVCESCQ